MEETWWVPGLAPSFPYQGILDKMYGGRLGIQRALKILLILLVCEVELTAALIMMN